MFWGRFISVLVQKGGKIKGKTDETPSVVSLDMLADATQGFYCDHNTAVFNTQALKLSHSSHLLYPTHIKLLYHLLPHTYICMHAHTHTDTEDHSPPYTYMHAHMHKHTLTHTVHNYNKLIYPASEHIYTQQKIFILSQAKTRVVSINEAQLW